MKPTFSILLAAAVAGCGGNDVVAEDVVAPNIAVTSEIPGDWSALEALVDRTPADSGLLKQSPITVDLNALLGRDVPLYRLAMSDALPLRREGGILVTVSRSGAAYLVLDPADHALAAGLKVRGKWRTFQTSGADVALPAEVSRLLKT